MFTIYQATGMTEISRGLFSKNFRPGGGKPKIPPYPLFPLPAYTYEEYKIESLRWNYNSN